MRIRMVSGLALAAVLLVACGNDTPDATGEGSPPTGITLQLKWHHQAQFAGYYLADAEGLYEAAGLDVDFLAGGPEVDEIGAVGSVADFGVTSPEELIVARSQGIDLVAVAAIIRVNPVVWVSHPESGIDRPEDFVGRRIANDSQATFQFRTVMTNLGLDPDSAIAVPYEFDFAGFLAGDVDVTFAYATGGLVRLQQRGVEVTTIWPADYGVNVYADVLVTTPELIDAERDLVRAFVTASLEGWQRAVERPADAVAVTMEHAEGTDVETQTLMMEASVPLIHTGKAPIGTMEPAVWQSMHDMLVAQRVIDAPIDVAAAYTLDFLGTAGS